MIDYKKSITQIATNSGITINGQAPWDIQVHNEATYKKLALYGTLGLGESYMDGWWDCEHLDVFFERVLRARLETKTHFNFSIACIVAAHLFKNLQTRARAKKVAEVHYDLNNEFYRRMLDKRMIYSCGYWKNAGNLDDAQEAKLDLICRKLYLEPGDTVLDIGCGWGGFAKFAAENYGVTVTGVTISREQAALAKTVCRDLPIEILLQDYRNVNGKFDKIVSVGMFEHVGRQNYRSYMEVVHDKLKDDGIFLLHTIGHRYKTISADPWVNKYIFPNGKIPYVDHIGESINNILILEDWHNFGMDYAKTLAAWNDNFEASWSMFKQQYDQRFYRMWKYYLNCFIGAFQARHMQLWQLVLTKPERPGMYHSIRN